MAALSSGPAVLPFGNEGPQQMRKDNELLRADWWRVEPYDNAECSIGSAVSLKRPRVEQASGHYR